MNSQSAMFLQTAQLVSDLHHRASFDTPALLRELIAGAAESAPRAEYAGITVTDRRRPAKPQQQPIATRSCWTRSSVGINRDRA